MTFLGHLDNLFDQIHNTNFILEQKNFFGLNITTKKMYFLVDLVYEAVHGATYGLVQKNIKMKIDKFFTES